jgi:hypothetical protein
LCWPRSKAIRHSEQAATGRFVARLAGAESVNAVVEIARDSSSPLSSILFLVDTIRRGRSGNLPIPERQLGLSTVPPSGSAQHRQPV